MRFVMHMSLLDDAARDTDQPEGTLGVTITNMHGFAIRDGESFKDALKQIGWFDVAVELEIDPFDHASVTKLLIHPDSDLKDTASNRKWLADQTLKAWAMAERKRSAPIKPSRNQAVVDDFMNSSPQTVERVKDFLNQGLNVVAVMGDGVVVSHPYQKTNDARGLAMTLQEEMVKQTGKSLPIGPDGKPRFAFLIWHSTDQIDAPFETGVVTLGDPTDLQMLNLVKSHGLGRTHKRFKLEDVM